MLGSEIFPHFVNISLSAESTYEVCAAMVLVSPLSADRERCAAAKVCLIANSLLNERRE